MSPPWEDREGRFVVRDSEWAQKRLQGRSRLSISTYLPTYPGFSQTFPTWMSDHLIVVNRQKKEFCHLGNDRKWQRKESKTSRKDPTVTSAGWVWQVVAASMVANDEGDIRIPEDRRYLLLIAPLLLPVRENLKAARGFSRRCGPPWTLLDRHIMKEAKPKQGSKLETGTCQVRGGCFRPKKEKTTTKALQGY